MCGHNLTFVHQGDPADSSMPYYEEFTFNDRNEISHKAYVWVGQEGDWIGSVNYVDLNR